MNAMDCMHDERFAPGACGNGDVIVQLGFLVVQWLALETRVT
ncbi:hypothetical protein SAMN04488504_113106 [Myxococcus virescens]|uniref:Uncharacterized protein n=1 Tax=Myxococcus virescens TaxID=83456 RepID=A0ABY0N226_9BACT|nr:hypothetical protein SAMN04488504_113106 [Myxococcus virescens]